MTTNEKNAPYIRQWLLTKFNDLITEQTQKLHYFSAIRVQGKAAVDKHFIVPNPAATAEKAMGETFEKDRFW